MGEGVNLAPNFYVHEVNELDLIVVMSHQRSDCWALPGHTGDNYCCKTQHGVQSQLMRIHHYT